MIPIEQNRRDASDVTMVRAFVTPEEWRTMGRVSEAEGQRIAIIHAKSVLLKNYVVAEAMENRLLISRSTGGWGSDQAAKVAVARQDRREPSFMDRLLGRDTD